ncbi:Noggin [Nesidiocoris tenuis]|uniref:Noggin n=1 Tax=Nesidiocoris tenuis TaxID=355587 RepID=A0ABN7BFQ6_9HEMI|nr:Noggin [Nesidiocoris tenuis]
MIEAIVMVACLVGWAWSGSPESHGLRPGSPVGGLLPDLIEPFDPSMDPKPSDLNATFLASKLGQALDLDFSSIAKPSKNVVTSYFPFRRNRKGRLVPVGDMPKHVRELELGYVRLGDGTKLKTRVPSRLRKKLRQLLWALTACPVGYRWRDMGLRFWPRWLKEGYCPATTCSVPAGMKCRPSAREHKYLLRWHCRKSCTWIKVQYPVVTDCACACGHGGGYS